MKAWLKGGLIGLGINLVLLILDFIIVFLFMHSAQPETTLGFVLLLPFLFYFLPFAFIIGALVGKFKNRNN